MPEKSIVPTRTNEQWLSDLSAPGPSRELALEELRALIASGLHYALTNWLSPDNPQFSTLTEEVTQETLLRVLGHLDTFEGRSQFTTWAHKIAVRVALTELRRRRWQDVSLEGMEREESETTPSFMADPAPGPEAMAERGMMVGHVLQIMRQELSQKQLMAMTAVAVNGVPLEEVARRMGTERNALYKLLHDARLRLKKRMEREGMSVVEMLSMFDRK